MSSLTLYELLPAVKEVLDLGKEASFMPNGKSMKPFLLGGKSEVLVKKPCFPLKRYDIALYKAQNGALVLHRVVKVRVKGESATYVFRGDNTYQNEIGVTADQILAVVARFKRKNKWRNADSKSLRLLAFLWCLIYPVRAAVRFLWRLPIRALRKIKRMILK